MTKGLSIHTDKLVTCTSIFHILGSNLEVFGPNPSLQGEVKFCHERCCWYAPQKCGDLCDTRNACQVLCFSVCDVKFLILPYLQNCLLLPEHRACRDAKFSKGCSQGNKDSKDRNTSFFLLVLIFPSRWKRPATKECDQRLSLVIGMTREEQFKNIACQGLNNNLWTEIEKQIIKGKASSEPSAYISEIKAFTGKTWQNNKQES